MEELRAVNSLFADRARIIYHLPAIQNIHRSVALGGDISPLPPPKMFVILPNMACTLKVSQLLHLELRQHEGQAHE